MKITDETVLVARGGRWYTDHELFADEIEMIFHEEKRRKVSASTCGRVC